jgi:hypothetical protein
MLFPRQEIEATQAEEEARQVGRTSILESNMLKQMRVRLIIAIAKAIGVPIKIRDSFYEPLGCSHVFLEPIATVAGESNPP